MVQINYNSFFVVGIDNYTDLSIISILFMPFI